MRLAIKILVVIFAGVVLGLCITWLSVGVQPPGGISDGPWQTNLTIGDARADPYTRTTVALHGLFALGHSETIYYTAQTDSAGDPLEGRCRYELRGGNINARWWSVTAYGPDDYLIANAANRYSVSNLTVAHRTDGTFFFAVGGRGQGGDWIATGKGRFSLTLRLYNPGPEIAFDPEHAALPTITKAGCS